MTATTHTPRIDELLPAYALGALDGEELRELQAHLAAASPAGPASPGGPSCPVCQRELRRLAVDLEALAGAAATVPAVLADDGTAMAGMLGGVRQRLLAAVVAAPRPLAATGARSAATAAGDVGAAGEAGAASEVGRVSAAGEHLPPAVAPPFRAPAAPVAAGRRGAAGRPAYLAGRWQLLAAAAVLVLVAAWGLARQASLGNEVERLRGERRQLAARADALERQLSQAQAEAGRLARTLSIIAAPGVESVRLAGMGASHAAAGRTYVNTADRKAVFYAFGLPALGPGKTYQLWYLDDEEHATSAGVFNVDASGKASLVVDTALPVERVQAWAVTVEPSGGRPQPTGPMALAG